MSWFNKHQQEEERSKVEPKLESVVDPNSPFGLSEQEQLQKNIFISTFAMLAKMASADGSISKREAGAVDAFMKNVLKLDDKRRQFAIKVFNRSRNSEKSFRDFAEEYQQQLQDKPEMFPWMVDVLLQISLADQVFSQNESDLIQVACDVFKINSRKFEQLKARHEEETEDSPYKLLGIASDCSNEELEARYIEVSEEFDPKKIVSLGLPEEFVKVAEAKHIAICEAYLKIKKSRL